MYLHNLMKGDQVMSMKTIHRALIKNEWFEVLEINTTTRKAKVVEKDNQIHLVDLDQITVFTQDYRASDVPSTMNSPSPKSRIKVTRVIPKK